MERLKVIWHPSGLRRLVILRRDDGHHTFIEEMRWEAAAEGEADSEPYFPDEDDTPWTQRLLIGPGLYFSAEDAEQDAILWVEGYRTLN